MKHSTHVVETSQRVATIPRSKTFLLALGFAMLSIGCVGGTPPTLEPQEIYRDRGAESPPSGLIVKTIAEGERVMLIKSPDDLEKVCSPRESDEGLSYSKGFDFSIPTEAGSVGVGEESGDSAIALGSPSDLVQLAREMLFRACELTLNLNANSDQTLAVYDNFLTALQSIASSFQASTATTTTSSTDTDQTSSGDGEVTVE